MLNMPRFFVAGSLLLALGACQTTSLGSGTISKIQAAGYQPATSVPSSIGPVSSIAVYVCPASRCGERSAISVNTLQANSNAKGETLETQIRNSQESPSALRATFSRHFDTASGSQTTHTVRRYVSPNHAGLLVGGVGKTPDGKAVYFTGRFAVKGNTGLTVLGIAGSQNAARKAMNLALED